MPREPRHTGETHRRAAAPRLSIVVPVLNEAGELPRLLDNLAPLRRAGHELIVVDGGSTDAGPALAEAGADRVLAAPRGRARQMNAGAAAAGGAVLWFMHADTRLPADALPALERALSAGARWGFFRLRIGEAARLLAMVGALATARTRLTGIATGDQAIFVRAETFAEAGGFPDCALMEDVELSRRLRRLAPPACLPVAVVTSGRRWHRSGVVRTVLLMWRLRLLHRLGAGPQRLARRYPDVR